MNLYHCFLNPFQIDRALSPPLIVEVELNDAMLAGSNGIFIKPDSMTMKRVITRDRTYCARSAKFSFNLADSPYLGLTKETESAIRSAHDDELRVPECELLLWMTPTVIMAEFDGVVSQYRFVESGPRGALALRYFSSPIAEGLERLSYDKITKILQAGARSLEACEPLTNDRCSYWKWNPNYELERKFTFPKLNDVWEMVLLFHYEICAGKLPGFVPETDKDFQIFDYDSTIYEIAGPPEEQGYISFIPLTDGNVTVKRKWFTENAELRKESLSWGLSISPEEWGDFAASLATGAPVKLTTFRRKRFDVNFESLETGHVFGIYFDICRDLGGTSEWMSQCEVEYCRTRTLIDIQDVYKEFEEVCLWTEEMLRKHKIAYTQDLYSKLDFARKCHSAATRGRPA